MDFLRLLSACDVYLDLVKSIGAQETKTNAADYGEETRILIGAGGGGLWPIAGEDAPEEPVGEEPVPYACHSAPPPSEVEGTRPAATDGAAVAGVASDRAIRVLSSRKGGPGAAR